MDSVSAFANTDGGTVLLGLSEVDGFEPVVGFAIDKVVDQFVEGMGRANAVGAKLTNPPAFTIERRRPSSLYGCIQ